MQSYMLVREGQLWLRQERQWLVVFHQRQNQYTSRVDFVTIISEINQNCLPKRTRPSSKIAISRGAQRQQGETRVTGLSRMSRSLFLQRCVTESRQIYMGLFLRYGLILKISFWGWRVCRMGRLLSLRRRERRGTQGWSSLWWQASRTELQILSKLGLDTVGLLLASCLRFLRVSMRQLAMQAAVMWQFPHNFILIYEYPHPAPPTLFPAFPCPPSPPLSIKPYLLLISVINSEMYQLSEKVNTKFGEPLLVGDQEVIVQNEDRGCTDILCLIFFLIMTGAFVGLLVYGLIQGNPKKVIYVYNAQQIQCYNTDFPYGFFPVLGSVSNAVCLQSCPGSTPASIPCLSDGIYCNNSILQANNTYPTTEFQNYCVPNANVNNQDLSQILNTNLYSAWAVDLRQGYLVLIGAAVAAMIAALAFLLFIRCCAGVLIWLSITVCVLGMELVGILFILEAKGINISSFVSDNLSTLSYNSLIIIGSGFIAGGVFITLIVLCLRTRINLGSKSVQLGAIFIFQNCCGIILPITQALFVASTIAAIIIGGLYLYSLGDFTFPDNVGFPVLTFSPKAIVAIVFFIVGGLWLLFFFLGCNSFILCSAVSIWYFNNESQHELGKPFGDSLWRLVRYHPGSVAITALINCVFEVVKILANLFSFQADQNDQGCTSLCLKCLSYLFCIFKCFLRFLNNGTYVQIAVDGSGYCSSTAKAYNILADNATKIAITDGISFFFKLMGILGIGVGITVAAYFICQKIEYLAKLLTNPLVVTIASGLIAFVVAGIYLSMIDLSAQSIIQCYFVDLQRHNGKPKHSRQQFREIILVQDSDRTQ